MKFGLQINRFDWPGGPASIGSRLAEVARNAEAVGFNGIWVMDHFYQIEPNLGRRDDPMLEAYSILNYLASVTERVTLGVMVTGVIYRHPGFLIKQVSTLDVLSGGRAYFGIGAAWHEEEAKGLGFPFPPLRERFEQLEEVLQIARQVWAADFSSYEGKHFKLEAPINSPQPVTKPHPPILIGGEGEKKTLRLVARYGDACNFLSRPGVDSATRKLDLLRGHCEQMGRDYDRIEKTILAVDLPEDWISQEISRIEQYAEIGVDNYIISIPDVWKIGPLEEFGEKIRPRY